jgi:type I restriction enzyme S subunit
MKNGTIVDTNLRCISDEIFKQIEKYIIEKDDLYITIAGTIGAVGDVPKKSNRINVVQMASE